jgi:hypothetical protein
MLVQTPVSAEPEHVGRCSTARRYSKFDRVKLDDQKLNKIQSQEMKSSDLIDDNHPPNPMQQDPTFPANDPKSIRKLGR